MDILYFLPALLEGQNPVTIDNVDVTFTGNVENRVLEIQFRDGSGPIGVAYTCTVINASLFSTCTPTGAKTLSTAVEAVLFRVDN